MLFDLFAIFFGIFFTRLSINGIRDKIFFLSVSAYLIPFWPKIMPERGFLIFLIFCYFFRNFLPQAEFERKSGQIFFFLSFSAYVLPFCYFFRNFLSRVEYERNWGLKFFSLFLGLTQTVLDSNNAGSNFFNFFAIFF